MKKMTKMIVAALLLATGAMSCPNWESNVAYEPGDVVVYNGTTYVAARTVSPNTAPNPADNGWFWTVSTEPCTHTNDLESKSFSVDFGPLSNTNQIKLDNMGVLLKHDYPVGGGEQTTIGYNEIALKDAQSYDTTNANFTSAGLDISASIIGSYGPEKSSTSITASKITTTGSISLNSSSTTLTLEADKGLELNSSFGSVTINDKGLETTEIVKADNVISGEVNLNQKLAELEARIAELEAAK